MASRTGQARQPGFNLRPVAPAAGRRRLDRGHARTRDRPTVRTETVKGELDGGISSAAGGPVQVVRDRPDVMSREGAERQARTAGLCEECRMREAHYGFRTGWRAERRTTLCFPCFRSELGRRQGALARQSGVDSTGRERLINDNYFCRQKYLTPNMREGAPSRARRRTAWGCSSYRGTARVVVDEVAAPAPWRCGWLRESDVCPVRGDTGPTDSTCGGRGRGANCSANFWCSNGVCWGHV